MARDCGAPSRQDFIREKKREEEFKVKFKEYKDALKEQRRVFEEIGSIWKL